MRSPRPADALGYTIEHEMYFSPATPVVRQSDLFEGAPSRYTRDCPAVRGMLDVWLNEAVGNGPFDNDDAADFAGDLNAGVVGVSLVDLLGKVAYDETETAD